MPLGVSPGMNARLWCLGLTPKNRNHAGAPVGRPAHQLRWQPHGVAQIETEYIAVEVQRLLVVAGGQHDMAEALVAGDELVAVWAHHAAVLEGGPVENLQAVAGRILEPDHLVDAPIGELGLGGLLVRRALEVEAVADLLQSRRIRALPAGFEQAVVFTRHDHQPGREVIHPQVQRTLGQPRALDHAEHLEAVLAPGRHVGGLDAQIAQ